jgi:catechol 2,3-dioxygenase-like lactoylglutathione lyase family enzyme
LGGAAPVLRVLDVERTCRWYQEQLGFSVTRFDGEDDEKRAMVSLDAARILICSMAPEEASASTWVRIGHGADIQIPVAGIEGYFNRIRSTVRVMRLPRRFPRRGVITLIVEDCDGHVLLFTGVDDACDPAGP